MFGARRGLVLDRDLFGVVQVLLRDPADLRRHGRGEQRDVLVVGGVGEDRLDVLGEAHVEHLVGLVEHQEAQLGEVERALLEVVHDPARGADDDVHAAAQRAELDAVRLAAVDGQHVHALDVGGVLLERLADLERELAGRREHQRLRRLLRQVEAGQDRQRERRGLAGAGLREADDVAAGEQRRDGRGLDGGGRLVADIGQRLQHLVAEPEVGERHLGGGSVVVLVVAHPSTVVLSRTGATFVVAVGWVTRRRRYSTVTDLARLRGLSMSWPSCSAAW